MEEVLCKTCSKCRQQLPLTMFSKHEGTKDGHKSHCKTCSKLYAQQYYAKNREKKLQQNRNWYEANKELRNKQILAYQKARPDWRRCVEQKSYQKHRDKRIQKTKKWLKDHPELHAFRAICDRTVNLGLPLDYQMEDWQLALEFFNFQCAYCGDTSEVLEKDHIVSLSKEGPTIPANIVPVCRKCNIRKRTKSLKVWYPTQKFYSQERLEKIHCYQTRVAREVSTPYESVSLP